MTLHHWTAQIYKILEQAKFVSLCIQNIVAVSAYYCGYRSPFQLESRSIHKVRLKNINSDVILQTSGTSQDWNVTVRWAFNSSFSLSLSLPSLNLPLSLISESNFVRSHTNGVKHKTNCSEISPRSSLILGRGQRSWCSNFM